MAGAYERHHLRGQRPDGWGRRGFYLPRCGRRDLGVGPETHRGHEHQRAAVNGDGAYISGEYGNGQTLAWGSETIYGENGQMYVAMATSEGSADWVVITRDRGYHRGGHRGDRRRLVYVLGSAIRGTPLHSCPLLHPKRQ